MEQPVLAPSASLQDVDDAQLVLALLASLQDVDYVQLALALSATLQDVDDIELALALSASLQDVDDIELGLACSASLQDVDDAEPAHEAAQLGQIARHCLVCYENIGSQGGGMSCPLGHFVCVGCSANMVKARLDGIDEDETDSLLAEHRTLGGHIPCVRYARSFNPPCQAVYTDGELARTLHESLFVRYRQRQVEVERHNRFLQEVEDHRIALELDRGFRREDARLRAEQAHAASADCVRRTYPHARMCPRCGAGPVINQNCPDLAAHHGQASSHSQISNACPSCGFFSADWNQWLPWDGVLPR